MPKNIIKISDFLKHNIEQGIEQIYGPEALNPDGGIIPFNDQAALITHYAVLRDDPFFGRYYDHAVPILHSWYEWINENRNRTKVAETDFVADNQNAFQTYLFYFLYDTPTTEIYTLPLPVALPF